MSEEPKDEEHSSDNDFQIFSTGEDKLKLLGELLSNESSRRILVLLTSQELTANDLAEKAGMRLSLVIHHLKKMQQIDIVQISRVGKNSKNHQRKYYLAKPGMLILPQKSVDAAKKSKTLSNSLKRILKYSIIGVAGIATWFGTSYSPKQEIITPDQIIKPSDDITDFSGNGTIIQSIPDQTFSVDAFVPVVVTLLVISCCLFLLWISKNKKD